jgi:hypothetical protein
MHRIGPRGHRRRRLIVDNAVRKFRNAAEEARARMRDEVKDFTDRVNAEWAPHRRRKSTR